METKIDGKFWNDRYSSNDTGWDIGYPSTPIKEYIDQLTDKEIRILIPGCGNSYEAEYLLDQGFKDVTLIDISELLVDSLRKKFEGRSGVKIIHGDFFQHDGQYDLILEQTFFCALEPGLRTDYANQMSALLKKDGKLAGLMFHCDFEKQGPPFGGSIEEYKKYFEPHFMIKTMDACYNSILPRAGNEVFVIFTKR